MSEKQTLRCLSVRNPWAWAICAGQKTVENRNWSTDHRGTIAIHAGASRADVNRIKEDNADDQLNLDLFTFSAVIGLADVEDVVEYGPQVEENPWASGPKCWLIKNGRFLEQPVPLRGQLQLFNLDDNVARQVLSQPTYEVDLDDPKAQALVEAIRPPLDPLGRHIHLTQFYIEQENYERARMACDASLRLDPTSAHAHFFDGCLHMIAGSDDDAIASFGRSIELNETFGDAYFHRGNLFFGRGEVDRAWNDFQAAIERDAEWGLPHIGLAAVLDARGEYARAIDACDKALELSPDTAHAYLQRAKARLGLRQFDLAIADATQSLELMPDLVEALSMRSEAYEANGDTARADRDRAKTRRLAQERGEDP